MKHRAGIPRVAFRPAAMRIIGGVIARAEQLDALIQNRARVFQARFIHVIALFRVVTITNPMMEGIRGRDDHRVLRFTRQRGETRQGLGLAGREARVALHYPRRLTLCQTPPLYLGIPEVTPGNQGMIAAPFLSRPRDPRS